MLRLLAFITAVALSSAYKLPTPEVIVGRRSAIGSFLAVALPTQAALASSLADQLAADEAALAQERAKIGKIDKELNGDRAQAFNDEMLEKQVQDKILEALKKDDLKTLRQLSAEARVLKEDEEKMGRRTIALRGEEDLEIAYERQLEVKVRNERRELNAQEDKAAIEMEMKRLREAGFKIASAQ